ncbi:thiamine pyrophosphate-dependent enzyme [Methanoplanus limicola]|uniref:Thiamine pyrophosphate TPP-binding domain-containing protein n=1 Tax=Methanoplanus limicola DSM 2279 TaxID=937775 RepID=H1YY44_9EURY|nr:thiamine pyrophosphate-dependent enzyme [Methanoplanus limicola]EHQ36979.1 thiamine pyrophosphate TPP-binding domain-containing protein [Methanoplanus limicola DSM 2279]
MTNQKSGCDILADALLRAADTYYTVPGYPVTDLAEKVDAEYVINEKTALEYALGDSLSGRRSAVIVKNAGMNILADPMVNAVYQGIISGVLIIAGDDTKAIGSQTCQDSTHYAEVADVPLIVPNRDNLFSSAETAFQASERFSRPAILKVTEDILENSAKSGTVMRKDLKGELADPLLTMKGRCESAGNITADMYEQTEFPLTYPPADDSNPKARTRTENPQTMPGRGYARTLCRNCPYKELFSAIKDSKREVICDTGCSLLSKNPPYNFGIANYGLGSSVAAAAKSTGIALTGDYALLHSGINSLIDVFEKELPVLVIVLLNKKMGMTGGQDSPDLLRYIQWAEPEIISSDSIKRGSTGELSVYLNEKPDRPKVILISGACPAGEKHEKIKC